MDYKTIYEQWLADPAVGGDLKAELRAIAGDEREIEDRFYKELEFGTGGMRGVLGAGANRMNILTVGKATQGLANYIMKNAPDNPSVVIAHDCRRMSPEFTEIAALTLNGNGIRTYVFDSLRPTPLLSFAVRYLNCTAGIVVTASHNPPEYNGYKVYWSDGGQVPYPRDEEIINEVNAVTSFSLIKHMNRDEAVSEGLFNVAGADVDDAFTANVKAQSLNPGVIPESGLRIVYTPLHGAGNVPVRRALAETGFKHVYIVAEQEAPDGDFPTVSYPNPEDKKAFALALAKAAEVDADIVIATDPDCDRVGAAVKTAGGEYGMLTGNMTGVLLTDYILSQRAANDTLPINGAVVSTIVSTAMTRAIADKYMMAYMNVLTGFKYIGEKIKEFEEAHSYEYLFGFEESYGCLSGTYARDKDAVVASLLLCELAAYCKKQGKTLYDALEDLYKTYGYYKESVESITLKGVEGLNDMRRIMSSLREAPPKQIAGIDVTVIGDYLNKTITYIPKNKTEPTLLPASDVLRYTLNGGAWCCVRPSGTEPKIKLYFGVRVDYGANARAEASELLDAITRDVRRIINY